MRRGRRTEEMQERIKPGLLKPWNLERIALLDGKSPTLADRPPYKKRGEAALRSQMDMPVSERFFGTFYRRSSPQQVGYIWRALLSTEDWAALSRAGQVLRLCNPENEEELLVEVVQVCLNPRSCRIEIREITSDDQAPRLVPVRKLRSVPYRIGHVAA